MATLALPVDEVGRRYRKGIDWGGAALSTLSVALLTYSLSYVVVLAIGGRESSFIILVFSESTASPRGWKDPQIPSLFVTSIALLVFFILYELRRERTGLSVLMPMSIWKNRGPGLEVSWGLYFLPGAVFLLNSFDFVS
jgi:hypothetical protein